MYQQLYVIYKKDFYKASKMNFLKKLQISVPN